jgi:hypothetical protein
MLGASLDSLVTSFTTHSMGTLPRLQDKGDSVLLSQGNPLLILLPVPYSTRPCRSLQIMRLVLRTILTLLLVHQPTLLQCLMYHMGLETFSSLATSTFLHHPHNHHLLLPTPPMRTKHKHTRNLPLCQHQLFPHTGPLSFKDMLTPTP